jgi:hypothetical protein
LLGFKISLESFLAQIATDTCTDAVKSTARARAGSSAPLFFRPPHGAQQNAGWEQLTHMMPQRMAFTILCCTPASGLRTAAASPKSLVFAKAIASASVSNDVIASTGPNISSFQMVIEGFAMNTVGSR